MDSLVVRNILVKFIWVLDRAVFCAHGAAGALVFPDIAGLFPQPDPEITRFPLYAVNFSIGNDFDVGVPVDLDQLGREYSHRTVIGGEGFIQLGHVAPDGGSPVNQVNLEAHCGQVQGSLDPADPSADHHDVSEITAGKTFKQLFAF